MLVAIIYMILGYWATGKTIYANRILTGTWNDIFLSRLIFGLILGWVLIPIALIRVILKI